MKNEKRFIDANALKRQFIDYVRTPPHFHYGNWQNMCINGTEIDEVIANAPTVDAVEVKCKVGDYVYALWEAPVKLKYIMYCAQVKEIRISMRSCRLTTTYILEPIEYRGRRKEYFDVDFGKLVFLEESEAQAALYGERREGE